MGELRCRFFAHELVFPILDVDKPKFFVHIVSFSIVLFAFEIFSIFL